MFASLKKMDRTEFWVTLGLGITVGPACCAALLPTIALTGNGSGKGVVVGIIGLVLLIFQMEFLRIVIHGTW